MNIQPFIDLAMPDIKLNSPLLREIGTLVRAIHTIYDAKFKHHALQKSQFIFLTRIYENPGISLVDLAYNLKIDKTTNTKSVQKLIRAGYVSKKQDMNDKRIWHLYTSETAAQLYQDLIHEENRMIDICLHSMSSKDQQNINNLIAVMRANVTSDWHITLQKGTSRVTHSPN